MEKPYRGLTYHDHKKRVPLPPGKHGDAPEDDVLPAQEERCYPDGSEPRECWAADRAFGRLNEPDKP